MTTSSSSGNGEHLLSIPQVAERLGVSARKTWRLISQGQLKVIRVGERGTRIRQGDLNAYIERLTSARA